MPSPRARRRLAPDGFYGWHIVGFASIALAATGPGQTVGVSLFIDPLIADLGISRSAVSTAYLIGTLCGALLLPWLGRALDRHGVRRSMLAIGAAFGLFLLALSFVRESIGLTLGFAGIRMAGQGALGLAATTAVALWFDRRRGFAAGVVSAVGSLGISATPLLLEGVIAEHGWRTAWRIEGVVVWLVVIPIALWGMRDRPSDLGQVPDGAAVPGSTPPAPAWGRTRAEALRSPYFWLVAGAVATSGMLTTAVSFHQISLLTQRGLTAVQAAANYVPQTLAGLVATLAAGWAIDRLAGRWMIVASMLTLSGALVLATSVGPGLTAISYGILLGSAGSVIRAVEAASLPRAFGVRHIGGLRGLVAAISVGGTAVGPLLFAQVYDTTGSYGPALVACAAVPVLLAAAAVVIREPHPPRSAVQGPPTHNA